MADRFVRVRLIKIAGADLNLFEFDYDLTWVAFFLSPDERVYGRYGGRDAKSAEGRLSTAGFKYAMTAALAAHQRAAGEKAPPRGEKPLRVEDYPAAQRTRGECVHCHQVAEFRRTQEKSLGTWKRDDLWVYPLPENVGITLDVDRGDRVKAVGANSAADRAGLKAGDVLRALNDRPVASFADAQYALHKAPAKGEIPVEWDRAGQPASAKLTLADGWRKTNVTWRPSMLDILPSLPLSGDDLTADEKKALGLSPTRLAFRQDPKVHRDVKAAGVQGGDVVIGLGGATFERTMSEFLGHVRRNYLAGDRVVLNVLRAGKRVDLPLTLK